MSISTIVSVILGFASLIIAFTLEGGKIGALLEPTAAMIVFGGTIGAVGLSFPFKDIKKLPGVFKTVFMNKDTDYLKLIDYFKDVAAKTRKEGLLSIEKDISDSSVNDAFIKKGLSLVVDGVEPQTVRSIMEFQAYSMFERHKSYIAIFEAAGGFGPTMGIIGTVMGLVHVLSDLADPNSLGPKIAVAFIATLYGVASANLLWLPMANKLKAMNKYEFKEKELIIEAVLSIQEGLNPNTLAEKLKSFLDTEQAGKLQKTERQVE